MIGAAIEVHRALGPGFLERIYHRAMLVELRRRRIGFETDVEVPVLYTGIQVGIHKLDLVVGTDLIVELKATEDIHQAHRAQLTSYLRATHTSTGLILNFGRPTLQIRRLQIKAPSP